MREATPTTTASGTHATTPIRSGIVKISNVQQLEDNTKAAKSTATDARMFMLIMNKRWLCGCTEKNNPRIIALAIGDILADFAQCMIGGWAARSDCEVKVGVGQAFKFPYPAHTLTPSRVHNPYIPIT